MSRSSISHPIYDEHIYISYCVNVVGQLAQHLTTPPPPPPSKETPDTYLFNLQINAGKKPSMYPCLITIMWDVNLFITFAFMFSDFERFDISSNRSCIELFQEHSSVLPSEVEHRHDEILTSWHFKLKVASYSVEFER